MCYVEHYHILGTFADNNPLWICCKSSHHWNSHSILRAWRIDVHEMSPSMRDVKKDDFIIWDTCIDGLVQAARQYKKKVLESLREVGFIRDNVNPCFIWKKVWRVVNAALSMNDNIMIVIKTSLQPTGLPVVWDLVLKL